MKNIEEYFKNININGKQGSLGFLKPVLSLSGVSSASSSTTISPLISRTNSREFDRSISNLKLFLNSVNLSHAGILGSSFHKLSKSQTSLSTAEHLHPSVNSVLVILSGLPATGKSTIAKYLLQDIFKNHNVLGKIYNAGNVRRNYFKDHQALTNTDNDNYKFFNSNNPENKSLREKFAMIAFENCLNDLLLASCTSPEKNPHNTTSDDDDRKLYNQLKVGIFDATNSNRERRSNLLTYLNKYLDKLDTLNDKRNKLSVIFLDIKCTNLNFWKFNIELKISSSPDYTDDEKSYKNIDLNKDYDSSISKKSQLKCKSDTKKSQNKEDKKVERLIRQLDINSSGMNINKAHKEKLIDFINRVILYLKKYEPIMEVELQKLAQEYLSVDNRMLYCDFGYIEIDNSGEKFFFYNVEDIIDKRLDNLDGIRGSLNIMSTAIEEESHDCDNDDDENDILSFSAKHDDGANKIFSLSNFAETNKSHAKQCKNLAVSWIFDFIKNYKTLHGETYLKKASIFSKSINGNNNNFGATKDSDSTVFKELLIEQGLSNEMLGKLNYHVNF